MLDRRCKTWIADNNLESSDQTVEIAISLFQTELLDAKLVESVEIPDSLFT